MGFETIAIAAIAASAVASTASAISASKNNSRSIQAQKDLYEQQREDQLSDYNERTGINAQAQQLSSIGVNPASVFSGGSIPSTSMPSVPSVPSAPQLENVGSAATGSISQMVSAVGSIHGYREQDARVKKLQQEYETERFNTAIAEANSFLVSKYGDASWYADLMDKQNSAYLKYAQGDLTRAETLYKEMLTNIANEEYKMKKEDALTYVQRLQLAIQHLRAETDLLGEQRKTEKSQQALNYANVAEVNTRKAGEEFDNVIKHIDSDNAAALAQTKLSTLREQYMRDGSIAQMEKVKALTEFEKLDKLLKAYREHPDKAALDASLDNFNEHFPILGGFFKALSKP